MNTTIFNIDRENIDQDLINKASDYIINGDLVAFPTETVYGLGADGLNCNACKKIYKAKGRPGDNPLILHISSIPMLYNLVDEISPKASLLIDRFWPGPLTIIFKKSARVSNEVTAGLDTVAVRFPKDPIARSLIKACNTPIAAPSANISGRPSPTRAIDVYRDLNGKIPLILDGGASDIGIESTVIDVSEKIPTILRPGFYTIEDISELLDDVRLDDAIIDSSKIPKSPGQKYKHYAPRAQMQVFIGDNAPEVILEKAIMLKNKGKKVGILSFDDSIGIYKDFFNISFGDRNNLSHMSHNLFTALRMMDESKIDIILAEGVSDLGLGKSIMNRMKKSASNNIKYI